MKKRVIGEPADWAALRASLVELIEAIKKEPNDLKRAQARADEIIRRYAENGNETTESPTE